MLSLITTSDFRTATIDCLSFIEAVYNPSLRKHTVSAGNDRPISQIVYDASGRKHIVRNGKTVVGKLPAATTTFVGDETRYIGSYIMVNDTIDRLQTPYGYLKDGKFYSYVFDYQGNVMAVVNGNDVAQTNFYYADGLPMNTSTEPTANAFKYTAKELSLFRGLPVYDYTARHTLPAIGNTFRTMDPYAEKYVGISPFAFCAGDPINFTDPTGMEMEITENVKGAIEGLCRIINTYLSGGYEFSVNENGIASLEQIDPSVKLSDEQQNLVSTLNKIIKSNDTTHLNLTMDSSVLIGEMGTATIDVSDLQSIGSGEYLSDVSAFCHEAYEQYVYQTIMPSSNQSEKMKQALSHCQAIGAESRVSGVHVSANRHIDDGSINIDVYPSMTQPTNYSPELDYFNYNVKPIGRVLIHGDNGKILNVERIHF